MAVTQEFFRLSPNQLDNLRAGLAAFATQWNQAAILDSCHLEASTFPTGNQGYSLLAGFSNTANCHLPDFFGQSPDPAAGRWQFGHLNYELKDLFEPGLQSSGKRNTTFSDSSFFVAEVVFLLHGFDLEVATFNGEAPRKVLENILNLHPEYSDFKSEGFHSFPRDKYFEAAAKIQQHLQRGDVYELNYCIPFIAGTRNLSPAALWRQLNKLNPAPFSALYRQQDNWLICASPERFLKRSGNRLYSQPIKGTIRRDSNPVIDAENARALVTSEKERAENIMITDLVRNDLSKVAAKGSVRVEDLCGLYPFRHVYQLITTISAELRPEVTFRDLLQALFPMGSMTGAPKYRAMELIEELEDFRRELFSGSVGYIAPSGAFDFNVVIRSMLYNSATGNLLVPAGSAHTAKSDPQKEYEECLLKAKALIDLINHPVSA